MEKLNRSRQAQEFRNKSKPQLPKGEYLTFGRMLSFIIFVLMLGIGALSMWLFLTADSRMDKRNLDHLVSEIVDKDGKVVGVLGGLNYEAITPEKINDTIKDSFIATEDSRFYSHNGVDVTRLSSAVANRGESGGGSTITQQLVKNRYLTSEHSITRKINEAIMALALETEVSKEKLLSSYLNLVNLGGNTIGIQTASNTYFGKDQSKLTLPESAILGGLPQLPNAYNPHVSMKRAIKRRQEVLGLMLRHGYIDQWEFDATNSTPLKTVSVTHVTKNTNHKLQAFFDIVAAELQVKYHYQNINKGMIIKTNLDTALQKKVYDLKDVKTRSGLSLPGLPYDFGMSVLNVKDGTLAAAYGGRKFQYGLFNNAYNLKAQPGSSIKPIVVYGPGVEYKKWDVNTKFVDAMEKYSHGAVIRNFENTYFGTVNLWTALAGSLNVPAVLGIRDVGYDRAQDFAKNLGLFFDEGTFYESYALGAFVGIDELVNPMEMSGAYAAYANNGYYIEPHAITSIKMDSGKVKKPEIVKHQAMSRATAYIMVQAMHKTMENSITSYPGLVSTLGDSKNPYFTFGKSGTTTFDDADYDRYGWSKDRAKDQWSDICSSERCLSLWTGFDKIYKNHTLGNETYQFKTAIADATLAAMKTGNEHNMNTNPPSGINVDGSRIDGSGSNIMISGSGSTYSRYNNGTSGYNNGTTGYSNGTTGSNTFNFNTNGINSNSQGSYNNGN